MHKYLYTYPRNVFNGQAAMHELEPLSGSAITKATLFAGRPGNNLILTDAAVSYLYLELTEKLDVRNTYKNLRLYENLLCLVSGKPAGPGENVDISRYEDFDAVLGEYAVDEEIHDQPTVQHHGLVLEYNVLERLPACVHFLNRLGSAHKDKVEQALATFIVAEEIGRTVNPHTKSTIRASLYLSAINQLADNPELCSHRVDECPVCHKRDIQHQKTSHVKKIEELMRELFTGENLDNGVRLIRNGYHRVRSPFLHDGILSGGENEGGWIADNPTNLQFEEDLINYTNTCRQLILLFAQKYGS